MCRDNRSTRQAVSATTRPPGGWWHVGSGVCFVLPVLAALAVWEILARAEVVNPRLFPPPTQVWSALCEWYVGGDFWRDVKASLVRMLAGLAAGGGVGVALGMITGRSRIANALLAPLVQILRPLPPAGCFPHSFVVE